MKKGAVLGITAAFIIIAMLIFIPVIVNNGKAPADTSASATDGGTAALTSGDDVTTRDASSDLAPGPGTEVTVYVTETDPVTDDPVTDPDTTTEKDSETTADETTAEEETTTAEKTTTAEETTTAETTTTADTTRRPPETTAEQTTKAPTTTTKPTPLDPEKKYVAFTFDDGPDAVRSKAITDKMLEYGGKCTFFVVGNRINGDREKGMQYAYEHGMEIAIHCWSHEWYYTKNPEKYHDEVYKAADAIKNSIGVWPTLMRPPGGNITESQYKSSEFPVILWSVDTNDWRYKRHDTDSAADIQKSINTIVNNALYDSNGNFNVKNGDIILMHEIYENSYDAFCIIIEELSNRGFEFVTVSELLQNPSTGYKYYSATYKKG